MRVRRAAMDERVQISVDGAVADVQLNRPDKRNALDDDMLRAIIGAADRVASDRSVRAVVLSGAGKGFCAGLDMSLFGKMAEVGIGEPSPERVALRANAIRAVRVWIDLPVPVIAAVHGAAVGGGLQLALGADIRIVAPDAQLGAFEIRWGFAPDMGGTQLLPRLVGADVAKELMWTGRLVSGEEAVRIGLATRVSAQPHDDALALAHDIAGRNPDAVRAIKHLVQIADDTSLADGLHEEEARTAAMMGTANQVEAVRSHLEQRAGRFD